MIWHHRRRHARAHAAETVRARRAGCQVRSSVELAGEREHGAGQIGAAVATPPMPEAVRGFVDPRERREGHPQTRLWRGWCRPTVKARSESAEESFLPRDGVSVLRFSGVHKPPTCFMNRPYCYDVVSKVNFGLRAATQGFLSMRRLGLGRGVRVMICTYE